MTKEQIIEKFKENAEKYSNQRRVPCWAFCIEDFEDIVDELFELIEQEKREYVKHFAFLQIDRIERSIILSDDKQVNSVLKATAKGIARSYKDYTGDGNEIK